jgi:hypothetical protein
LRDKSVGLIKWRKAGLEYIPISPCHKRRIRRRAKKDYRIGKDKNSPSSFNSNTYKGAVEGNSGYWRLLIETFMGETLCPAHAIDFW